MTTKPQLIQTHQSTQPTQSKQTLPKPLYESLPYFYMAIGMAIIGHFQTVLMSFSGVCFFIAGAVMWVLRSDNRRKDVLFKRRNDSTGRPELYELKPFIYLLAGVLCSSWAELATEHAVILDIIGVAIAMSGLYLLLKRMIYRR